MSTAEERAAFALKVNNEEFNAAIDKYLQSGLDFSREFRGIGNRIVSLARQGMRASLKDPARHPGRSLHKAIRNKSNRGAVRVVMTGCRYAGVHHWGWDGKTGPKYLDKARNSIKGESLRKIERHLEMAARAAKLK